MSEQHAEPRPGVLEGDPDPADGSVILFSPRNVWRIGWTIFALIAIAGYAKARKAGMHEVFRRFDGL